MFAMYSTQSSTTASESPVCRKSIVEQASRTCSLVMYFKCGIGMSGKGSDEMYGDVDVGRDREVGPEVRMKGKRVES